MLSNKDIWPGLASRFAALRLDWEQGNHYRDRFGFVLGTGDQLFLKPDGALIPPATGSVYGRHGEDITPDVLARVHRTAGSAPAITTLDLDWFFWPRKPSAGRPGGFYPPPVDAIAGVARHPVAEVHGHLPDALEDTAFLKRHVRQFIWKRGDPTAAPSVHLFRVRDGLPPALPTDLATLDGEDLQAENLGPALDRAWLTYMENRPLTARGYLENEHGGWMRGVADQMLEEDRETRRQARAGSLRPAGRQNP